MLHRNDGAQPGSGAGVFNPGSGADETTTPAGDYRARQLYPIEATDQARKFSGIGAYGMVRPRSPLFHRRMLVERKSGAGSTPMTRPNTAAVATLGIDIGKNVFHLIGLNERGAITLRQRLSRRQLEARLTNMPPCLVGMEACVGAHHLGRQLRALGHDVRLMPAKYVRPYSKGQKNDYRDAEAIAEAVQRPTMKFVAIKTVEQLDLQALHRVRERLVSQRTGIINQIRAFLLERGIAVRQGPRPLRSELPLILTMDKLSPRMVHIIEALAADWRRLDERIEALSSEIAALAEDDAPCQRLMTVPGIGPIISSATVAAIGMGDIFSKGRDFGAWLGLVPRQMSTGGLQRSRLFCGAGRRTGRISPTSTVLRSA
jgi:transposase